MQSPNRDAESLKTVQSKFNRKAPVKVMSVMSLVALGRRFCNGLGKIGNRLTALSLSMALGLTSGCSVFQSSHQTVSVQTSEPQAKVWINGSFEGEAPVQASVMRNQTLAVMVKKEGFQTSTRLVQYHLSTTGILDVVGTCLFLVPCIGLMTAGAHDLDDTA
jgi:hypothetical protein